MKSNKIEIVPYKNRLQNSLGGFNYFFGIALLISIIVGSWPASIIIALFLVIRLYLSYLNIRYYIFKLEDKTDVIEVSYYDKKTSQNLKIEKKDLKIDLIDDGFDNHLRFYYKSNLLLKQYPVGYWTRRRLSKFYENYCKGKFEISG